MQWKFSSFLQLIFEYFIIIIFIIFVVLFFEMQLFQKFHVINLEWEMQLTEGGVLDQKGVLVLKVHFMKP